MKFLVWQGKKSRGSFIVKQCTSLQCTVQGWTKKGTLGCVNPASRLPLAAGGEVTQPRARFFAQPCTYRTETRRRPSYCLSVKNEAFEKIGEPFLCRPKLDMSQKKRVAFVGIGKDGERWAAALFCHSGFPLRTRNLNFSQINSHVGCVQER